MFLFLSGPSNGVRDLAGRGSSLDLQLGQAVGVAKPGRWILLGSGSLGSRPGGLFVSVSPVAQILGLAVCGRRRGMGAFFVPQVEVYENWKDQSLFWEFIVFSPFSCRVSGLSPLEVPGDLSEQHRGRLSSRKFSNETFCRAFGAFGGGWHFSFWSPARLVNFSPIFVRVRLGRLCRI